MKSPGNPLSVFLGRRIARRSLLRKGAVLSIGVGALTLIGCSSDDDGDDEIAREPTPGSTSPPGSTSAPGEPSPYAGSYTITNEATGTEVTVSVENGVRSIAANGLPDHETGEFPNPGNPNAINAQSYEYTLPLHPSF